MVPLLQGHRDNRVSEESNEGNSIYNIPYRDPENVTRLEHSLDYRRVTQTMAEV